VKNGEDDTIEKLAFFDLIIATQVLDDCPNFYNALGTSSKKNESLG